MTDPTRLSDPELGRALLQAQHAVACKVGRSNRPISGSTLKQYERELAKLEREKLRRRCAAVPTGARTVVRIGGTTFRLPALPPDDSDVIRHLQAQQDALLATARTVKRERTGWRPPTNRRTKPGDGTFAPEPAEIGAAITVWGRFGGEEAEPEHRQGIVVMLAPSNGDRWVSFWDGEMPRLVHLDPKDKRAGTLGDHQAERLRDRHAKTTGRVVA